MSPARLGAMSACVALLAMGVAFVVAPIASISTVEPPGRVEGINQRTGGVSDPTTPGAADVACPPTPGFGSTVEVGPGGWPRQSNTVPRGYPTPTTHSTRLTPGYPPREP